MPKNSSPWRYPLLLAGLLSAVPVVAAQAPDINISGAPEALRNNIMSHLSVDEQACDTSLPRLRRLQPQVRDSIQQAARALGYYGSTYNLAFTRPDVEGSCWILDITVEAGAPVRLDDVRVDVLGDDATRRVFRELLEEISLQPGQQLNQGEYEQVKNELSALAVENGFFMARFEQSAIRLDLLNNQADILIEFDPGERFTFGQINIDSGAALADSFVRALVPFQPGDPYASASLLLLRNNLEESQYFRQINISPQLAQASDRAVPVDVGLSMRPRRVYSAGIGFTTDTGPRLRVAYQDRYLNQWGHSLEADGAFSPVLSQVNANYRLPLDEPARESVSFGGGYITESTDTFDSDRFKLESAYRYETPSGWITSLFVDYQRDDYVINEEQDTSNLPMLGASLNRTRADNLINPSYGWRLFTQVRGASASLLSDVTFIQAYASGKLVTSLTPSSRLISRLEIGSTWTDAAKELPVSLRYFTGGDQSIRGYKYQALGPTNDDGDVVGGKHKLVASAEYDFRIYNSWRLALFADAGNAFNEPTDFDWKTSVGVGIRWMSPIGPIRFDLAHPLEGDKSVRFHITMGPDL